MEEQVGELWHKLVTRWADPRFPDAGVALEEVAGTVGIVFRALGGDGGLEVTSAEEVEHGARRSWLSRVAGSQRKVALAWRDENCLRLPASIQHFPERALNRELYLWLAALAVGDTGQGGDWFALNQALTLRALQRFPGLAPRYRRLVAAHLARRPDPARLKDAEARAEQAVRAALAEPGSVAVLPPARRPPQPVPLWLHPSPPGAQRGTGRRDDPEGDQDRAGESRELERMRRRGRRVAEAGKDRGLITIRMENIFTWGEFVNVDRSEDEEEDLDRAESVARDIDQIAVSRATKASAARLKFDLDLPSEADDDLQLGEGVLVPEWDWRKRRLQPDHCRIQPMLAANAAPCELPARLSRTAKRLRNQFQALNPSRVWCRGQPDGEDVDLDAYIRYSSDRAAGLAPASDALYRTIRAGDRDLACLLLADLSLSTDTWVDDDRRVIDVIRDSLYLFAESLAATGDRFGIYGFSSRRRDPVRVHLLKGFDERYGAAVRGRIEAIKPGYYTRMGAAVRYAAGILGGEAAQRRLLLILTDGKPNDLDKYEGRYGIEDTRAAVREARALGLQPFCVTIDERGNEYLPHLFGTKGYVVIRRPSELPRRLPMLYAQFTA